MPQVPWSETRVIHVQTTYIKPSLFFDILSREGTTTELTRGQCHGAPLKALPLESAATERP